MPFDWKTPCGYIIVAGMKLAASFSATYIATVFMCLLIGSCWTIKSYIKATTYSVSMLKVGKLSSESSEECKKRISIIAQNFEKAKQLSQKLSIKWKLSVYLKLIFFQTGQWDECHLRHGFLCCLCVYSFNHMRQFVDTPIGLSWAWITFNAIDSIF